MLEKNCKHIAIWLLSFADDKNFKSLLLTQKNTELQFKTDYTFCIVFNNRKKKIAFSYRL